MAIYTEYEEFKTIIKTRILVMQSLPFLRNVKNKSLALLANLIAFKKKTCRFSASILKIDKEITSHSLQLPYLFPERSFCYLALAMTTQRSAHGR